MSAKIIQFPNIMKQPPTFATFAQKVEKGNIGDASEDLSVILNLDIHLAKQATIHFSSKLGEGQELLSSAMQLRSQLESRDYNGAIETLAHVFGIQGHDAVVALDAIQKNILAKISG